MSGARVAVLDYGIGNLRSAQKALEHLGARAELTTTHQGITAADAVVLPGVGNFGRCVSALRDAGLDREALAAIDAGVPFLGICVGMQMLYAGSTESPGVPGLGVFPGTVDLLPDTVRRPQMQWNILEQLAPHPLLDGLETSPWVYFVHSYAAPMGPEVIGRCDYGGPVAAAVARQNLLAVQFHPEKSGTAGLDLLGRWLATVRS